MRARYFSKIGPSVKGEETRTVGSYYICDQKRFLFKRCRGYWVSEPIGPAVSAILWKITEPFGVGCE